MKRLILAGMIALLAAPPAMVHADNNAAPALPKTEDLNEVPDSSGNTKTDVDTPEGEPESKKESVAIINEKPSRFRWGNFLLGALGGACIVGGGGIAIGAASTNTGAIQGSKIGILAASGAVAGGILSFLLGATTPPPATPPDMKSDLFTEPTVGSADMLNFTIQF